MNTHFEWNDLRLILALERTRTLSGAARALGVSHATVFRKLAEIERRAGTRLFERSRSGLVATAAGEEAAAAAARIEGEVHALERHVIGRDLRPSGTVGVTTTDTLLQFLLAPAIAEFCDAFPEIDIDVVVSNDVMDLSARQADIAIRPSSSPPEHLVGRRLGTITQSVYGRRGEGGVAPWDDPSHRWIGPDEGMPYPELRRWLTRHGLDRRSRMRVNSMLGMYAAVRAGVGLAVLPDYIGRHDPGIVPLGEPIGDLAVDLWLLTHGSLRPAARIRAFMDFMGKRSRTLL